MGENRKRLRDQYEEDLVPEDQGVAITGVGATLAYLRAPDLEAADGSSRPEASTNGERTPENGGWIKVSKGSKARRNKRLKKEQHAKEEAENAREGKSSYPSLAVAELHKLHSMLRLDDLQMLLLYCLADGTAPNWVSIRHHAGIRKAVVLMVPGLEKGMFEGTIQLPEPGPADQTLYGLNEHDSQLEPDNAEPDSNRTELKPTEASQPHVATQATGYVSHQNWAADISPDEYLPSRLEVDKLPPSIQPLADIFIHLWPVKTPGDDRISRLYSPLHAMLTVHVPRTQEEKDATKNIKGPKSPSAGKYWDNVPTSIRAYITPKEDLQDNDYTLHHATFQTEKEKSALSDRRKVAKESAEDGWVDTAVQTLEEGDVPEHLILKGSLTAGRTVFAIDCEMCTIEGGEAALTRISLVSWDGSVVMDELVKPSERIIDYLTLYSGMTAAKLDPITTTLSTIQSRLLSCITPTTILVGHSLNSDLKALKLTHPFIIDTSLLYPHPRGPPMKSSLKWLAQKYLSREIQKGHGATGHDSVEDARACLDLVRMKCEKGPRWGAQDADRESIFKRLARSPRPGIAIGMDGASGGKQGAIVDHGAPEQNFGAMAAFSIGCSTDAEVVDGVRRAVNGDADGAYIPGGGVELTWARLRELEALRGWSNDNRNPSTPSSPAVDPSPEVLTAAVRQTVQHIKAVHEALPPCTLFMVYSGTGDPRELARLQEVYRTFKREFTTKKWDELSVRWTDEEEQALKDACRRARKGVGFVCLK